MKTFGYTMRDRTGALQRGSLQARDRQEALQQIRALGGTPVNVTEGGASTQTPFVWQPAWTRAAVVLGAAVVLIAGVVLYLQRSRTPPRPAPAPKPASVAPSGTKTPRPADAPRPDTPPANPRTGIASPRVPATGPAPVAPPAGSRSTASPRVAQATPSATEEPPEEAPPARPAPYQSTTEQLLAMMTSVPPGVEMPPLPISSDLEDDYNASLTNVLVIDENTTEEQAIQLENVAWAKVDLSELVSQGWKPGEILSEIAAQHNEASVLRRVTSAELKRMVEEKAFPAAELESELKIVNQKLAEMGMPEITLAEIGLDEDE
jgi:hypothetical protein